MKSNQIGRIEQLEIKAEGGEVFGIQHEGGHLPNGVIYVRGEKLTPAQWEALPGHKTLIIVQYKTKPLNYGG